jgi:hypothetical protein
MLSQAIAEINHEYDAAVARRNFQMRRRRAIREADALLLQMEELIESGRRQVPPPLLDEVLRFVRPLSRKLFRHLVQQRLEPVRVLDIIFDAQQLLLERPGGPVLTFELESVH